MKNKLFIGILIVIVIMGAVLYFQEPSGGAGDLEASSILSVDKVDWVDTNGNIEDSKFLITLVGTPVGTDFAYTTYQTLSADGKTAQHKVKIEIPKITQTCNFPILANSITNYVYKPTGAFFAYDNYFNPLDNFDGEQKCQDTYPSHSGYLYDGGNLVYSSLYMHTCVPYDKVGQIVGRLGGRINTESIVRVTRDDGEIAIGKIAIETSTSISSSQMVADLMDGNQKIGYIKLVGNLWSGSTCESNVLTDPGSTFVPIWDDVNDKYILNTQKEINDYNNAWGITATNIKAAIDLCDGNTDEQSCKTTKVLAAKGIVENLMAGEQFEAFSSSSSKREPLYIKDGVITYDVNDLVAYPVFQIVLNADWVGIGSYQTKPEILESGTTSECFNTGDEGYVTVKVKNAGDVAGNIEVKVVCPSPFNVLGSKTTAQVLNGDMLQPGQAILVNIPIYGQISGDEIKKTCTITATDLGGSGASDSTTVTACIRQLDDCGEQESRCFGNSLQECRNGIWKDQFECEYGCDPATLSCASKGGGGGGGETPIDGQLMFALIGFLIGFAGGYKFLHKEEVQSTKPFYRQKWFALSIIIGAVVAILFFMIYSSVLNFVNTIFPTFQCGTGLLGEPDLGCYMVNLIKLIIWVFIFIIILKFF